MSGYAIAGVWLFLVATAICTFALASHLTHGADDRDYRPRPDSPGWPEDQRTPGLGDLSSVEESTPLFDSVVEWEKRGRP
jgi:hypothetical protein